MAEIPRWWMKGDWFDVCRCNIPCPCEFAQPPTDNHCEGILAYQIREGAFGELRLDGLRVVLIGGFDGNIWSADHGQPVMSMFIDDRANPPQREALRNVFTGQAGGFMGGLGKMMEWRSIEYAPIDFQVDKGLARWSAEIAGRVKASAEALTGPMTPPGKRVQTLNPPGSETGPGQIATWGRAIDDWVDAQGFKWTWPGRSSKHIPFDWSGPN